jgi:hypothetical protein
MSKVITLKFFLQKTNNQLQTHSPKLSIAQQTLKNKDKGLVMDKGQLTKLQVENHGLFVQVTQDEQVAKKEDSLQHEYNVLNQFNWKNWNNMKTLQTKHGQLTKDYKKMEQSNYEHEINL